MKTIISTALLIAAGTIAAYAAPVQVKSVEDFDNHKVYTLKRDGYSASLSGFLFAQTTGDGDQVYAASAAVADTTQTRCHFSIHYSEHEKAYFLYNLEAGLFLGGNSKKQAVITSTAAQFLPVFNDAQEEWYLVCDGYSIGSDKDAGYIVFLDELYGTTGKKDASQYIIYEKGDLTLTDAQVQEIEEKVAAGREALLKTYQTFLKNANNLINTGDLKNYIGEYDLDELTYALEHDSEFSMQEIAEIYNNAVLSRYPREGKYYRIHNANRPGSRAKNILSTKLDGTVYSRSIDAISYGTATDDCTDDLNLFRVFWQGGDPTNVKIQAAVHYNSYLDGGTDQEYITLNSDYDDATTFTLEYPLERYKRIYIQNQTRGTLLSVTNAPDCILWAYSTKETPSEWYFEQIDSITIPVDANGYGTFCLPCGVQVPDDATVYTVTDFSGGKAYVEEIDRLVHLQTPCIIKVTPGVESITLPLVNNLNWRASAMVGNVSATTSTPGRYVPTFSASGISFTYAAATDEAAMPGSCYIVSDNQGEITTVMGANPEAGIEEITIEDAASRTLYDLMGRPVKDTPRPGVYINAATHKAIRVK